MRQKFNRSKLDLFLIGFISLITSGCAHLAYNETAHPGYIEKAEQHIIHVNKHGYIIPDSQVYTPISQRNSEIPMSESAVRQKYNLIIKSSLLLACDKAGVLNSDEGSTDDGFSVNDCKQQVNDYFGETKKGPEKQKFYQSSLSLLKDKDVNVIVFFHGGLNSPTTTSDRMLQQIHLIQNIKSEDWHYPVYVSWPSGILDTYSEYLTENREGRRINPVLGLLSAPIVVLDDLFEVIGEFPSNTYYQFTNEKDWISSNYAPKLLSSIWHEAYYQFYNDSCATEELSKPVPHSQFTGKKLNNVYINRSKYMNRGVAAKVQGATLTATAPIRYVIGHVYNSAIASNGYSVMKRRARNLFYPTGDFDKRLAQEEVSKQGSHAGSFFESIMNFQQSHSDIKINLSLVGHSMGAIAVNNLLTKYKIEWQNTPVLSNIVYMAGAANIQDTINIVPDILKANENTSFYNLTLNRVSENAEVWDFFEGVKYFSPTGSLLVSIDKYHDEPEHHLLRTVGSEINVHSSLPTILKAFDSLENRIVFKSFSDINSDHKYPEMHGDFSKIAFWEKATWQPADENNLPIYDLGSLPECVLNLDHLPHSKNKGDVLTF